jgi:RNA recognition motif-containing protein
MSKKLFVGNIPFSATETDVAEIFEREYGHVYATIIVKDRETGRSRGFGFVELEDHLADTALAEKRLIMLNGRSLRINEAWERGRRAMQPALQ